MAISWCNIQPVCASEAKSLRHDAVFAITNGGARMMPIQAGECCSPG